MSNRTKGRALQASALVLDVGAPLAATMSQFPVWVEESSEATVSGLFLIFAILTAIPLFRQLRELVKSPSMPVIWLVMFVGFWALRNIIDEMIMISLVGVVSNSVGTVVYKLGGSIAERENV